VVVGFSWADRSGTRHEWAHVVRLRDGRIVDIQDYGSQRRAGAAVRLRAAFG
jgi:hypothetical protein